MTIPERVQQFLVGAQARLLLRRLRVQGTASNAKARSRTNNQVLRVDGRICPRLSLVRFLYSSPQQVGHTCGLITFSAEEGR